LALDLQAQLSNSQKAKAEIQGKLEHALKELELAREREAKMISSVCSHFHFYSFLLSAEQKAAGLNASAVLHMRSMTSSA
jgi:hypothetical protein